MSFVRGLRRPGLGDALDDSTSVDTGADPLLQQLHSLAVQIIAQRNAANAILSNVSNADASVDWDGLNTALANIVSLQQQFKSVAAQRTAQNPYALSAFDNAILAVGDWAQATLNALPGAIAAVPDAIVNGLGKIVQNAGGAAFVASVPFLALAAAGVGLLLFAEKSRTVRKYA